MTQSIALIVGGSSGMGKETARRLLQKSQDVMILSHDASTLESAQEELQKATGGHVEIAQVDLYDPLAVEGFIAQINAETRHISHLVNAAGYFKPVSFIDHQEHDYDLQMDINKAFFFITQAVAKNMRANGGGSIVNIGSMWAKQAVKATPSSAYSMQKAGLHALTRNLAMELADDGIPVKRCHLRWPCRPFIPHLSRRKKSAKRGGSGTAILKKPRPLYIGLFQFIVVYT